jgi:NhaA family Na+:H+ antiporter
MTEQPPAAFDAGRGSPWPETPVTRLVRPFLLFLRIEAASGVVLLVCTAAALILANSAAAPVFHAFWETPAELSIGSFSLAHSLREWVNEGLMTIFFFVVGLEIKRELVLGELRDPRKAALPLVAALGGMLAPAAVYLCWQLGEPGERGWGIPVATDIAFVVGCLALLGPRVPHGLKIFLLTLAIADDIGAVLVIAVAYSQGISPPALAAAFAGLALCSVLNRIGVRRVPLYVVVGGAVWLAFLHSGIHATVAGVLLGLLTPASAWVGDRGLLGILSEAGAQLRGERPHPAPARRRELLMSVARTARETVPPLERLETSLHPWVAFGIMPLFALANAGVALSAERAWDPIAIAVSAGLVLGKPAGIFLLSWLSVTLRLARLPADVDWKVVLGAGCLGGIGFTMALFIAGLALEGPPLEAGKIGIFVGSAASALLGSACLLAFLPAREDGAAGARGGAS